MASLMGGAWMVALLSFLSLGLLFYYLHREIFNRFLREKVKEVTELEWRLKLQTQALEKELEAKSALELELECWRRKAQGFESQWRQKEKEAEQAQQALVWQQSQGQKVELTLQNTLDNFLNQRMKKEQAWQDLSLSQLLNPLKTQLQSFQGSMELYFKHESQERYLLGHELQKLQNLNAQLSSNATQLSEALRGDSKLQGSWGEMILEKVLEQSGLRKGIEYRTQVSLASHEEGKRIQPDVLVYLPNDRMVMVDAKVSLTAYTRYHASEDPQERAEHLQAHIQSVRSHIKKLSRKEYTRTNELETLDYVLLFMPVEPAFAVALQHHPSLLQEAQEQHVLLVTPATLMLSLKTIHFLWKNEHRSQQAKLISQRLSSFLEKFQRLVKGCESMGQALKRAQSEYEQTMGRLCWGKGNLLKQLQAFQSLSDEIPNQEEEAQEVIMVPAPSTEAAGAPAVMLD